MYLNKALSSRRHAPPPHTHTPCPLQLVFLSFVLSGGNGFAYKGRDLTSVHEHLRLKFGFSDAHFDLAKVFLREACEELSVPAHLTDEVLNVIESTRFLLLPNSIYKPKEGAEGAETLLDRMGGPKALKAVIDIFYTRLIESERTKHFFVGYDMQDQRERQVK